MKRIQGLVALLTATGMLLHPFQATAASSEGSPIVLSLGEAVETSLRENLGLQLRREDVAFAEGSALAEEGSFDALVSADIGATEKRTAPVTEFSAEKERTAAWNASVKKRFTTGTEMDLTWDNGNLDTDSNIYLFDPVYSTGLKLGLSQPLLQGLGSEVQMADLNSARSQLEARSFLVDSDAADLAARVKNAYWELVFAHQNLEVLQLSLKLAQRLRDDTAARISAGKLADIDLYQPESEVAQREQDLITGERAIGIAEDNLKLLMNSRDWLAPYNPVDLPPVAPVSPSIRDVAEKALENRPDIKAAALQIQASEYQVKKSENQILPALNLVGAVGYGGTADTYGSAFDSTFDDSDTQWQVGLTFSRPFDNSQAQGQYRQALATHNRNQTSLELLKQEIRRTVRVTVRDVELALKAIDATEKTAIATQKRLEAEQIKFDAGRATTLDVLIAQQDFARALSTQNRSKVAYAQSLAELDRIQGLISIP
jgi:outer membrane protein TolC